MNKNFLIPLIIIVLLIVGYIFLGHDEPRIETRSIPDEPKQYTPEPCLNDDLEVVECKG